MPGARISTNLFAIDDLNGTLYTRLLESYRSLEKANAPFRDGLASMAIGRRMAAAKERFYATLHEAVTEHELRTTPLITPPYADYYEPLIQRFGTRGVDASGAHAPIGITTAATMIGELDTRLTSLRHIER